MLAPMRPVPTMPILIAIGKVPLIFASNLRPTLLLGRRSYDRSLGLHHDCCPRHRGASAARTGAGRKYAGSHTAEAESFFDGVSGRHVVLQHQERPPSRRVHDDVDVHDGPV